ncbi:MAG: Smr/MutS family protein [Bacteroidales bacterium]|nr:Smr/MutS family protein [Bacteroidales bacterium]
MTNIEHKLGFDRIKEMVAAQCSNALAAQMAHDMSFQTHHDKIVRDLQQVEEFRQIMLLDNSFPSQDFTDMTSTLERLRIGNTVMELPEMFNLKCSLHTIADCVKFFARDEAVEKYPQLHELASHIAHEPLLLRTLDKTIDDKGEIYDNATETLHDIRRQMLRKRGEVDAQLSRSLSRAKHEGWAPENAEITIRNGRMVIPMLDTHRRKIRGLIHDESATRQTAYLEPSEVVELNNDLRELEFAEKHEIQKIILRICDQIRPRIDTMVNDYWVLARFDFIRAKASFALRLGAAVPRVTGKPMMDWLDARHPLLYLQRMESGGGDVVPFNLKLDADNRILIISGPNAGGKSVCLKAIGLIQYMLQCGLPVPCKDTSEFGVFDNLFIDIGDEQSIESDLSTYTSHLQNLRCLLDVADEHTLFLLDELGGGTEPRSGCAIAESLLEELCRRGSFGVVTTHFADLKLLADRHDAIINGAMLFDTDNMRPLYRLAVGHPGSSFAFEIATNIGFPKEILDAAGQKVGHEMLNFEHQLQQIELDKQEIARKQAELDAADKFLNEVIDKYQTLSDDLEARKREILSKARSEAKEIVAGANRAVEQTISDIKKAQAERQKTIEARERLKKKAEELEVSSRQSAVSSQRLAESSRSKNITPINQTSLVDKQPIAVGDIVKLVDMDSYAQVVELKGKKAVVESNSVRMTIALDRLVKTEKKNFPVEKSSQKGGRFQSIYDDINEKRKYFNPTLDLRGHRAEEALSELQHFLDEAQLLGEHELRILHGKGYGILKTLIREQLQANKEVQTFHSERLELGGDGITVVHLK